MKPEDKIVLMGLAVELAARIDWQVLCHDPFDLTVQQSEVLQEAWAGLVPAGLAVGELPAALAELATRLLRDAV